MLRTDSNAFAYQFMQIIWSNQFSWNRKNLKSELCWENYELNLFFLNVIFHYIDLVEGSKCFLLIFTINYILIR